MSEFIYKLKKRGRVVFVKKHSSFDGTSVEIAKVERVNKNTISTGYYVYDKTSGDKTCIWGYDSRLLSKEQYCNTKKAIAYEKNRKYQEMADKEEVEAKEQFKKSLSNLKEAFRREMIRAANIRKKKIPELEIKNMTFPELEQLEETQ